MNNVDISHELAMLVCQKCERESKETEIDFASRLYETYWKCKEHIEHLENVKISNLKPIEVL